MQLCELRSLYKTLELGTAVDLAGKVETMIREVRECQEPTITPGEIRGWVYIWDGELTAKGNLPLAAFLLATNAANFPYPHACDAFLQGLLRFRHTLSHDIYECLKYPALQLSREMQVMEDNQREKVARQKLGDIDELLRKYAALLGGWAKPTDLLIHQDRIVLGIVALVGGVALAAAVSVLIVGIVGISAALFRIEPAQLFTVAGLQPLIALLSTVGISATVLIKTAWQTWQGLVAWYATQLARQRIFAPKALLLV